METYLIILVVIFMGIPVIASLILMVVGPSFTKPKYENQEDFIKNYNKNNKTKL